MYIAVLCAFDYVPTLDRYSLNGRAYLIGHKAVVAFDTEEAAIKFAENFGIKRQCYNQAYDHHLWYDKYVVVKVQQPPV